MNGPLFAHDDDVPDAAPFVQALKSFPTYDFAAGTAVPPEFTAEDGSSLAICPTLFWRGSGSLHWRWRRPGATISYRHDEVFRNLTGRHPPALVYQWVAACRLSALCFYLFNPQAVEDVLWVEIGADAQVDVRCYISLNFTGWQSVRIWYGRDLPGLPDPHRATTLRLRAPQSVPTGMLYIDQFSPRREEEIRGPSFDPQIQPNQAVPWVNNPTLRGDESDLIDGKPPAAPYLPRLHGYHDFREHGTVLPARPHCSPAAPAALTAPQRQILAELTQRFRATAVPALPASDAEPGELLAIRGQRNLCRQGEVVSGNLGDSNHFLGDMVGSPSRLWRDVARVGAAWRAAAAQPQLRAPLAQLLGDLAGLVITQGHGATYQLGTAFVAPLFELKDFWRAQGLFAPLLARLRRIMNIDDFYDPQAEANADVFHTDLEARLAVVMAADDTPEKWRDLLAVQQWFERTSRYGALKSDGSFHHHWTANPGYTVPALPPLGRWLHFFHDTPFASPSMHQALRRVAYAFHFFTNTVDVPAALGGRWRHPHQVDAAFADVYRRLAQMGHPQAPDQDLDRALAGAYLFYAAYLGLQDDHAAWFRRQGLTPSKPTGHLSLNQSAAAVHRRADWMVFLRGHKHELMGMEAYGAQDANVFGRYINYGSLQVVSAGAAPNPADSGWPGARHGMAGGWDVNFWPGTTARVLPYEALRSGFMVEEQATEETFSVGTNLCGQGVYGLKLREQLPDTTDDRRIGPPRYWLGEAEYRQRISKAEYDTGFQARKSWFFFDDMVVALGSGIESRDQRPVVTTLFQHALQPAETAAGRFDASDNQQGFPLHLERPLDSPQWLIDKNGNGYYLPAQQATLRIKRAYADHSTEILASRGDTELAWLQHGGSVRRGLYEYALLIRSDAARLRAFSQRMQQAEQLRPYQVLQRDELAHVVRYPAGRVTGYVVFDARHPLPGAWLRSLSRPAVVMVRDIEAGGLELAVTDPEFGEHVEGPRMWSRGPMKPTTLYLEVNGNWQTDHPDVCAWSIDAGAATLLKVTCREGLPVHITLRK